MFNGAGYPAKAFWGYGRHEDTVYGPNALLEVTGRQEQDGERCTKMDNDVIYCGDGKEKTFDSGGSVIKVNICLDKIPEEYIREFKDKRYVNLIVGERKNGPSDRGETHWVKVDTWKPTPRDETQAPPQRAASQRRAYAPAKPDDDDINF